METIRFILVLVLISCAPSALAASFDVRGSGDPVEAKLELFRRMLRHPHSETHHFESPVDKAHIHYIKWHGGFTPETPILYLTGRGELSSAWAEMVYTMRYKHRFTGAAYVMDHRGQGFSEHLGGPVTDSYVKNFSDYVEDIKAMIKLVSRENRGQKPFIIAHSMGATALWLALAEEPDLADDVALITMMGDVNLGPIEFLGDGAAMVIINLISAIRPRMAFGRHLPGVVNVRNPVQVRTTDPVRAEARWRLLQRHHAYRPGKSARWTSQALKATRQALAKAHQVQANVLMFAAEYDHVVEPERLKELSCLAPHCRLEFLRGAYHASHEEADEIRGPMLQKIADHFRHIQYDDSCDSVLTELKSRDDDDDGH
ncbi:MAG: alpha/beta fold hydrolase [Bdellovibrionales bacterium]